MENKLKKIVKNWDLIDDKHKTNLKPDRYHNNTEPIKGLSDEGYVVILLLDRQKPSVEACYDFDEERFGINKFGEIIWGFDSGCSCPAPWDDSYPSCYNVEKTWKEFVVKTKDKVEKEGYSDFFDVDWKKEAEETIDKILAELESKKTDNTQR